MDLRIILKIHISIKMCRIKFSIISECNSLDKAMIRPRTIEKTISGIFKKLNSSENTFMGFKIFAWVGPYVGDNGWLISS